MFNYSASQRTAVKKISGVAVPWAHEIKSKVGFQQLPISFLHVFMHIPACMSMHVSIHMSMYLQHFSHVQLASLMQLLHPYDMCIDMWKNICV